LGFVTTKITAILASAAVVGGLAAAAIGLRAASASANPMPWPPGPATSRCGTRAGSTGASGSTECSSRRT